MVNIDIDIDNILRGLSSRDQEELLEGLLDKMKSTKVLKIILNHEYYADKVNQVKFAAYGDDPEFVKACGKIAANKWRLPLEQEQYILQIAEKL